MRVWSANPHPSYGFAVIRTIGIARAETKIGLANLAFNTRRLV